MTIPVLTTQVLKFVLPGNPIPKHRPRFARTHECGTGHVHHTRVYSDQSQEMQSLAFLVKSQSSLSEPLNIPVKVRVTFYMQIPKSLGEKRKRILDGTPHSKKPDLDNLIKTLDVLVSAGNVIKDDSLIAEIYAIKVYSLQPRTVIEISELTI